MNLLVDSLVFGVITGALVAIGALGFTLQYGVTNVFNLAYGAILTSAIYIGYEVSKLTSNLAVLALSGAVWGALLSLLLGAGVIRPFVRRGTTLVGVVIVTVSIGLIVEYTLEAIQGPGVLTFSSVTGSPIHISSATVNITQIYQVIIGVVLMLGVHLILMHTRLGLAMRATAAEPSLARGCGISTERVRALSWIISGGLCGICGILLGEQSVIFSSTTGDDLFILIVAGAIVGGIGVPLGAMAGGLLIGIISEGTAAFINPALRDVAAAVVVVLMLVLRPQGIFASSGSTKVLTR